MKKRDGYKEELIASIQKAADTKKLLHAFLSDILTSGEFEDIALRWQIIKQLDRGIPQRDIARDLGVSIAKITRGSKELRNKKGGFIEILKQQ